MKRAIAVLLLSLMISVSAQDVFKETEATSSFLTNISPTKRSETVTPETKQTQVHLILPNNKTVVINLFDSQASRDFMALLPLTLTFEDFAQSEKVASLPQRIHSSGYSAQEKTGDFTYYAPWGNLAIFYKGYGTDGGLIMLGRIVSGKASLADMTQPFEAILKQID